MHLFSPLPLGNLRLPNRIALTAMPSRYAQDDGFAGPALTSYYLERARGGAGLIVLEAACPLAPERPGPHLGLYDDSYMPALRGCLSAVRAAGAAVFVMIDQPLDALDADEARLAAIGAAWAGAAWRAHAAGADGVMFSCADGGPLAQLLSPQSNRRADGYGGDANGRMRLLLEIVERVRAWIGARLIIGVRLNVGEFMPGGLPLHDARVVAKRLAAAGARLVEVSGESESEAPLARFPGWRVPLAAGIRAVADVPVMVGGLLADAELADSVIREGSADIVALGESLRAEPRWPQYARATLARTLPLDG